MITLTEGLLQSWEFSSKNTTHTYQIAAVSATTHTYIHKVRSIKPGPLNLQEEKKTFQEVETECIFLYTSLLHLYTYHSM